MCRSLSHECIRGVYIEDGETSSRSFMIEHTNLPICHNQFGSDTKSFVAPIKSERSAKRRNPWQRLAFCGEFRTHVVDFASEPPLRDQPGFDARFRTNKAARRLCVFNYPQV